LMSCTFVHRLGCWWNENLHSFFALPQIAFFLLRNKEDVDGLAVVLIKGREFTPRQKCNDVQLVTAVLCSHQKFTLPSRLLTKVNEGEETQSEASSRPRME
jgi:hypothetical protein